MSGARSVRIIRGDKRLKSRNIRTNIDRGLAFSITGPLSIDNGPNFYQITVSGLATPYSAGQLVSLTVNADIGDLSQISDLYLLNPDSSGAVFVSAAHPIAGVNLTDTVFYNHNIVDNPFIETGTAPYTGNWKDYNPTGGTAESFDTAFDGGTVNNGWLLVIVNNGPAETLNSATLTFAF